MAARKRKAISDKTRFEVFKRDAFKCQYCGRCAPEILLELDHIEPHSKGGVDEIMNLLTSCRDCNSGKGDRRIDDDAVLSKQRAQLEDLNERREQLEMMMRWREAVLDLGAAELDAFLAHYSKRLPGWQLNESGAPEAKKAIKKAGLQRALDALDRSADQYAVIVEGKATQDSADHVWRMFHVFIRPEDEQIRYRCRGILRKRCPYVNQWDSLALMKRAQEAGASDEDLLWMATHPEVRSWTAWKATIEDLIAELEG